MTVKGLPAWCHAVADQAAMSGMNFLVLFSAARCMPVEVFGIFSLVWLAMLFAANIHQALLLVPLPVIYPERGRAAARRYVGTIWWLNRWWLVAALVAGLVCLAIWTNHPGMIAAGSLAAAGRFALETERRLAYAGERIDLALRGDAAMALLLGGYLGAMLLRVVPAAPEPLLLVLCVASVLGAVVTRLGTRHFGGGMTGADVRETLRRHWEFGGWVLGATVAMWLSHQSYPFIIAGTLSLAEVALFNAAKTILGPTHFLMQGIDMYAVPHLRRSLTQDGWEVFSARARRIFGLGLLALLLPCLLTLLAPSLLLRLFYGDTYADGGMVLRALAAIYLLVVSNRLLQIYLIALREPRAGFGANLINAMLTLAIAPLLIARYGLQGALWAFAINQLISLMMYIRFAVVRTATCRGAYATT